jgi:hypothetical protein
MIKSRLVILKFISGTILQQFSFSGTYGNLKLNYLLPLAIICISFSCQEKNTGQDSQVIGYSVDTVTIDSKERILNLNGWMMTSDLDDEKASFFLYNYFDNSIDEINLDQKVFVKTIPLETEGPNGVGEFLFGIQWLNDSIIFTKSYTISTLIDRNGQVLNRIDWESAKDSNGVQLEQLPRKYEVVSGTEDLKVLGLNVDMKNRKVLLDVLSVDASKVKRFDVDPEKSYHDFFFRFDDNLNILDPGVYLNSDINYIQISHEFSNEILLFNTDGEFMKVVHYEPQLTPKRADTPEGPEFKSKDQIKKDFQHILEQVRFRPPVWDEVKKRYFRVSSQRIFEEKSEGDRAMTSKTKDIKVFLSVFDAEFNLISEMEIGELNDDRFKYFAKDGKLWVCQNFSDQLGFLVFEL